MFEQRVLLDESRDRSVIGREREEALDETSDTGICAKELGRRKQRRGVVSRHKRARARARTELRVDDELRALQTFIVILRCVGRVELDVATFDTLRRSPNGSASRLEPSRERAPLLTVKT